MLCNCFTNFLAVVIVVVEFVLVNVGILSWCGVTEMLDTKEEGRLGCFWERVLYHTMVNARLL